MSETDIDRAVVAFNSLYMAPPTASFRCMIEERSSMQFDFSKLPLKNRAFSEKPMTFIDQEAKNF